MNQVLKCFSCGQSVDYVDKVGFRADCMHCHADVHVCRNCHFYDPKVYNECREPAAEVVREKDRANYCEFFQPSGRDVQGVNTVDELMSAAEALFKKKS